MEACIKYEKDEKNIYSQVTDWGPHDKMDSVLVLQPAAPGLILGILKKLSLDVAEM